MKAVYTDYFQKSKVFLYPLLNLKKGIKYVPIQTYVCIDDIYAFGDYKLICEYHAKPDGSFKIFCDRYLNNHKNFHKHVYLGENHHLFVFDLTKYKSDYNRFIEGAYSKFSLDSKLAILDFFISSGSMSDFVHGFLSPEFAHEDYAKFFAVDIELIEEVYELCSILNIEKETFSKNNDALNCLLDNNSIYLEK